MAKQDIRHCKDTCDYWGTTEGREVNVTREYFSNGEFHIKGTWIDTNEALDLPSILFNENEN